MTSTPLRPFRYRLASIVVRVALPPESVEHQRVNERTGAVVIDPRRSFGRPVLDGFGLRTAVLAERFYAGESVEDLARDYGVLSEAIDNALRSQPRAA